MRLLAAPYSGKRCYSALLCRNRYLDLFQDLVASRYQKRRPQRKDGQDPGGGRETPQNKAFKILMMVTSQSGCQTLRGSKGIRKVRRIVSHGDPAKTDIMVGSQVSGTDLRKIDRTCGVCEAHSII